MARNILSLCSVLLIINEIITQLTVVPTDTGAKNYCENNYCISCRFIAAANMKSCERCLKSVKKIVAGQTEVFECTDKNSVGQCLFYYSVDSPNTGCASCESNHFKYLNGNTNGKPKYDCIKSAVPDVPISNCQTIIKVGTFGNQLQFCSLCNQGYGLSADSLTCTSVSPSNQKQNCLSTLATGFCSECKSGYTKESQECVVYAFKGCESSTVA